MGDFNVIRSFDKKRGGVMSWSVWQNDLNDCLTESDSNDLIFMGFRFTWSNWQCNNPILKKLGRVLVNVKWE